jgi:hypothetical protein
MRYKVIGLALVLLIAGVSTVAAYEFTVSYDENAKFVYVQFPGAPPIEAPTRGGLPQDELINVIYLADIICINRACIVHLPGCPIKPCPSDCHCLREMTFDGNGKFVRLSLPEGGNIPAADFTPLERSRTMGVTKIVSIGTLLIFRLPDNKFVRCLNINGDIFASPPSDD